MREGAGKEGRVKQEEIEVRKQPPILTNIREAVHCCTYTMRDHGSRTSTNGDG